MITIFRHEIKSSFKMLLIWSICLGSLGAVCILLFSGMQESMEGMAESFASMGAFSDVFGMSQLSIATLKGFYATEIGTIHALGGAMFAAISSTNMLSKEEDGHTSEFLFTLSIGRGRVVIAKWIAVVSNILCFNVICVACYLLGIVILGQDMPGREFVLFHGMQFLMHLEIAGICYAVSAFQRKNKLGLGLGAALLFYAYDLMARVVPDLKDYKFFSPFAYANATEIFSQGEIELSALLFGMAVLCASVVVAYVHYVKKDLF